MPRRHQPRQTIRPDSAGGQVCVKRELAVALLGRHREIGRVHDLSPPSKALLWLDRLCGPHLAHWAASNWPRAVDHGHRLYQELRELVSTRFELRTIAERHS